MSGISAPVIGLFAAVVMLIFLVLRTRVHALIALIAAACIAGITAGLSVDETIESLTRGFGNTLSSIGLVIGLGVMMGRVLEVSGAAQQIANAFIRLLGRGREASALAVTGFFVSIPIFVDSAFVILFPVAKALARNGKLSVVALGVALAGGLVVTHTTVPPTPGPLGAAGIFGVDVGAMMLMGMTLSLPCVVAIVFYTSWLEKKFHSANGTLTCGHGESSTLNAEPEAPSLPGVLRSFLPIGVPIVLIFSKALLGLFSQPSAHASPVAMFFFNTVMLLGTPVIALSVSTLIAVYTLMPWVDRKRSNAVLEEGLQSAGIILLVTGAGGALGAVVRDSGAGQELANRITQLPISPIMIPFLVATAIRLIQGSGTVACITSASITAPVLSQIADINMLLAAQSAVMGALCFSYFNDSLYWVVNRMMGITELRQQILVWSVPTTIAWAVGGTVVAIVNIIWGSHGKLADIALPAICGILLWLVLWINRMKKNE